MKRLILLGSFVVGALLLSPAQARADGPRVRFGGHVGIDFGIGRVHVGFGKAHRHRGHRVHPRRHPVPRRVVRYHRVRVPVYKKIWVPPVHRSVFVGYDACHNPVYNQVVMRPGYYRTVFSHYRYERRRY